LTITVDTAEAHDCVAQECTLIDIPGTPFGPGSPGSPFDPAILVPFIPGSPFGELMGPVVSQGQTPASPYNNAS